MGSGGADRSVGWGRLRSVGYEVVLAMACVGSVDGRLGCVRVCVRFPQGRYEAAWLADTGALSKLTACGKAATCERFGAVRVCVPSWL